MNQINCEIIEDMLPLYVEHLASKSTEQMVEAHMQTCESCQRKLSQLNAEITIPMETGKEPIKGIQKKLQRKSTMIAIVSGLLVLVLVVLAGVHLMSPILIDDYEDAVTVQTDTNGNVSLILSEKVTGYSLESVSDIEGIYSLSCWNTKWNQLFHKETERTISLEDKQISKIYYYSPKTHEEQFDVLIYDSGEENSITGGITMPRLVLNAYILCAGIMVLAGVMLSVIFRKKDKKYIIQKLTLIPGVYVISSILILAGKGDIYNAAYYFSGIVLLTIVLYALVYYILNRCIWKH